MMYCVHCKSLSLGYRSMGILCYFQGFRLSVNKADYAKDENQCWRD